MGSTASAALMWLGALQLAGAVVFAVAGLVELGLRARERPVAAVTIAQLALRDRTVVLAKGDVFTVPRGTEHKPSSPGGAQILMFEPTGTPTVGDRHEEIPDRVDATTGHPLRLPAP